MKPSTLSAINSPAGTLVVVRKLKLSNGAEVTFDPPLSFSKKEVSIFDPDLRDFRSAHMFVGGGGQVEVTSDMTLAEAIEDIHNLMRIRWEFHVWGYFDPDTTKPLSASSSAYAKCLQKSKRSTPQSLDRDYLLSVGKESIQPFDPIVVEGISIPIEVDEVLERIWVDLSLLNPNLLTVSVSLRNRGTESRTYARKQLCDHISYLQNLTPKTDSGTILLGALGLASLATALMAGAIPKKRVPVPLAALKHRAEVDEAVASEFEGQGSLDLEH